MPAYLPDLTPQHVTSVSVYKKRKVVNLYNNKIKMTSLHVTIATKISLREWEQHLNHALRTPNVNRMTWS